MRKTLIFTLLSSAIVACSSATSGGPTPDTLNGAKVDILAEGGFAALSVHHVVSHDDRGFVYSMRHLCDKNCGAPSDTASGTLSAAASDSLFNIVVAADPFSLKDDYGPTHGGADMFSYTVRVTTASRAKTIRFDDGTMPPEMRRILQAVQGIVSAARK
jgi:hypothetical protein